MRIKDYLSPKEGLMSDFSLAFVFGTVNEESVTYQLTDDGESVFISDGVNVHPILRQAVKSALHYINTAKDLNMITPNSWQTPYIKVRLPAFTHKRLWEKYGIDGCYIFLAWTY